jgi:hypothetical protein
VKRALWGIAALMCMGAALAGAVPVAAQSMQVQAQAVRRVPQTAPTRPVGAPQRTIPLPQIVAELQSQPPFRDMNYIGVERFDPRTGLYALRFLNGRQVVVVHVDGRTGRVVNRGF